MWPSCRRLRRHSQEDTSEKTQDLLDVAPFSLSIKIACGALIKRSTTVPTKKSEICLIYTGHLPGALIRVVEGGRTRTKDNNLLDKFDRARCG